MAGPRISAVDAHVGRRIRMARFAKRVSQERLAQAAGVRFQQIQKYENGTNRIGTGRLHAIANFLEVPVSYFFEGMVRDAHGGAGDPSVRAVSEALSTREGVRIAVALSRIRNQATRQRIADLLEAMIVEESTEARSLSHV